MTVEMYDGRCTVIDIVNIDPRVRRTCAARCKYSSECRSGIDGDSLQRPLK